MKKLIAVILAVVSFTVIQTSAAVERMYYDFTFADGYYYDLKTGVGKSDARFAVSSRKPVKSDSITIVGSNWHHVLWWGDNNQYLGYHNSTNSSYKTNLFNAYETSYSDIDVIDNDSFVTSTSRYSYTIFGSDWVLDNIIPGVTYTMSYNVTLLYKPDTPTTSDPIAIFRLHGGASSIYFASIPRSQYLDWEVGVTVHVENTIKIPAIDLSGYSFYFNSAIHGEERPIMRVDNVRLTAGTTIPTGQYFGTAGSVVTPPENAKYFSLQVCKDRDNLIDFERYPPQGALQDSLMVVNKNTIQFARPGRVSSVYAEWDEGLPPDLWLKYGEAYYIEYTMTKLYEDGLNDDDVGIFFWWPYYLDPEDIGLDDGPPVAEFRLAQGVDNDLFQLLPIGEFARVAGTFIAHLLEWEGGPGYGHIPPPALWIYTTKSGSPMWFGDVYMEFGNVYILPAGSYDMYITPRHIDPSEVYMRFCATRAYYEREITETPTVTLPERLDNWLDSNGLNNTFFKILLSVVLMTVVAISLALMHAPASVVIFGTVLVLALVAFFGWIPLWLIIMAALVLLLTTIFKLKGAGGGGVEDD